MKPTFQATRAELAAKPPHGAPCNRCGLCCRASLCELARHVHQRPAWPGPCPSLVIGEDDKAACGIVEMAATRFPIAAEAARLLIGSDTGCDARFNGEPANDLFYWRLDKWDHDNADAIRDARAVWGMK
jgi:hypothetical protein